MAMSMVSFEGPGKDPCWKICESVIAWNSSFKKTHFFLVSSALFLLDAKVPHEIPTWVCTCYQIMFLLDFIKPNGVPKSCKSMT